MSGAGWIAALDLGATSVKGVVLDQAHGWLRAFASSPIKGDARAALTRVEEALLVALHGEGAALVAVTGGGGAEAARATGVAFVGEIAALHRGAQAIAPRAGSVLEVGGEHARFLRLGPPDESGARPLRDFSLNSACSAGTGAFLEQEAHRLRLPIVEFSARAAEARAAAHVAGRCAVFAKTDVVHQHQNGVPVDEIAFALCLAMAQCIGGELIGGRPYERPVAFLGGVASNAGMRRALRRTLKLEREQLLVPESHAYATAIGAALVAAGRLDAVARSLGDSVRLLLAAHAEGDGGARGSLLPLEVRLGGGPAPPPPAPRAAPEREAIGVDIGSTTTNVATVSDDGEVGYAFSVSTRGQPIAAVQGALATLESLRGTLACRALGITGSGRKLVAELLGADLAVNEITAHAAGCAHFHPDADTVIDIGGQDSKFIRLSGGAVADFEMNKVCAAGTGSFLEEMAEILGLDIVGEFEVEAAGSASPSDLGERCTVFLASEIARRLRDGASRADLAAGLSYAVVRNYLARVVGRHAVGERIVFQGGVAANRAVVAALRRLLGREVVVHPHHDTAGAIGAALLAAEATRSARSASRFTGVAGRSLEKVVVKTFDCVRCANRCTIHMTESAEGRRFFSGGLCDEFEGRPVPSGAGARPGSGLDLFAERDEALRRSVRPEARPGRPTLGIPRALVFHETLPFWGAFLASLGVGVTLSDPTTRLTLERGSALVRRGSCLPIKIAYGHIAELAASGVKRIFVPSLASLDDRTVSERLDHLCPVEQAWPYTARALFPGVDFVAPRVRFSIPRLANADLIEFARSLGASRAEAVEAIGAGHAAQRDFHDTMLRRGEEVLAAPASERGGRRLVAVLARSYTSGDAYVALRLKRTLEDAELLPVPMEMLRDEPAASGDLHGMYWYFGKRVLQQARARRRAGDLPVLFLSSFGCGPDSFVVHMLRRELGSLPSLELEIDEHSEMNGVQTRCEAFRHSLDTRRKAPAEAPPAPQGLPRATLERRKLFIPRMSDHAFAFAAAFRSCGVDAAVLPMPDEASIQKGSLALGGGECLPCACVTGDMLRHLETRRADDRPPAFFMVSGDGPCRLGQYPWVQRAILDDRGHSDVPIFNASQDPEFYRRLRSVSGDFQRTVWRGTVATDILFRKWRERRARVLDRAEADRIHRQSLAAIEDVIGRRGDLRLELEIAFDRLEAIPERADPPWPVVAILGENYVRCNDAANHRLAERLEALGADVVFPSLCEWVEYTNWTARLHCSYEKRPLSSLRLAGIGRVQQAELDRLEGPFRRRLVHGARPGLKRIFELAAPYVPATFEGETIVGVGRTIDLHDRGVGGVIHVAPFGCMVGGIVEILGERISEDLGGFPILSVQYDGRNHEATESMLEAFVARAGAWQSRRAVGSRGGDRATADAAGDAENLADALAIAGEASRGEAAG